MMKLTKSQKIARKLVKYIDKHPELRFWQALRNFSKYNFIYVGDDPQYCDIHVKPLKDTFYMEDL